VNLAVGSDTSKGNASDSMVPARGGRNQELVLAAIAECRDPADWKNTVLLSAGTDGEDGPTDAAGAIADESLLQRIAQSELDLDQSLARHDSYHFFDAVDGLFKTGPTHTNVMDLRVGLRLNRGPQD
jgi:glycerate 2-kinase